jgi:hypothetical protein
MWAPALCAPTDHSRFPTRIRLHDLSAQDAVGFSLMVVPALPHRDRGDSHERARARRAPDARPEHVAHAHVRRARDGDVQSERDHLAVSQRPRSARQGEFRATGGDQVLAAALEVGARPNEMGFANSEEEIQRRIELVSDSVFKLYDSGQHERRTAWPSAIFEMASFPRSRSSIATSIARRASPAFAVRTRDSRRSSHASAMH